MYKIDRFKIGQACGAIIELIMECSSIRQLSALIEDIDYTDHFPHHERVEMSKAACNRMCLLEYFEGEMT